MASTGNFAVRFTESDLAALDRVATHHHLTRASTLRMLVAQAAAVLPGQGPTHRASSAKKRTTGRKK